MNARHKHRLEGFFSSLHGVDLVFEHGTAEIRNFDEILRDVTRLAIIKVVRQSSVTTSEGTVREWEHCAAVSSLRFALMTGDHKSAAIHRSWLLHRVQALPAPVKQTEEGAA